MTLATKQQLAEPVKRRSESLVTVVEPVAPADIRKALETLAGGMPASGPPDPAPAAPRNRHQRRREKSPRWQRRTALDKARQK